MVFLSTTKELTTDMELPPEDTEGNKTVDKFQFFTMDALAVVVHVLFSCTNPCALLSRQSFLVASLGGFTI